MFLTVWPLPDPTYLFFVVLYRRDRKGCSNGCYVLGYRVYVNGCCWQSVDGALTSRTVLECASISNLQHSLQIYLRFVEGKYL